jgi:SP family myo-inositol transporter-like MFS transporter 13
MIIPLYIAELSPARFRGRMISIDMIFLGTGSVLAYAFDAAFYKVEHGWRYMIGIGAVPSIILGILLFWCPESPRQLMYHGHREKCEHVIRRIYVNASEQQIQEKLLSIEHGVNAAKSLNEEISLRKSMHMLFTIPANRRAAIAACGLMFFQQFCGFNTLVCLNPYSSSIPYSIATVFSRRSL